MPDTILCVTHNWFAAWMSISICQQGTLLQSWGLFIFLNHGDYELSKEKECGVCSYTSTLYKPFLNQTLLMRK